MSWFNDVINNVENKAKAIFSPKEQEENTKDFHQRVMDDSTVPTTIEVKKGDTLWGIANRYNIPLSSLQRSGNSKYLQIGEKVTINPMANSKVLQDTVTNKIDKQNTKLADGDVKPTNDFVYYAKPGDSLKDIAKRFKIPEKALKKENNSKYIQSGEGIHIKGYKPEFKDLSGESDIPNSTLMVLHSISKHFGAHLKAGQSLSVPVDTYLKFLNIKNYGYANNSLQNIYDNKDINNIKEAGDITITKTNKGFKISNSTGKAIELPENIVKGFKPIGG